MNRLEHIALNVPDPAAMARWYAIHFGWRILLAQDQPPLAHFLADSAGVMLELYRNESDPLPDYAAQKPARLHVAFSSDDPAADADRLTTVGATVLEDAELPVGGRIITLRDPWGVPIQLVRRPPNWPA